MVFAIIKMVIGAVGILVFAYLTYRCAKTSIQDKKSYIINLSKGQGVKSNTEKGLKGRKVKSQRLNSRKLNSKNLKNKNSNDRLEQEKKHKNNFFEENTDFLDETEIIEDVNYIFGEENTEFLDEEDSYGEGNNKDIFEGETEFLKYD